MLSQGPGGPTSAAGPPGPGLAVHPLPGGPILAIERQERIVQLVREATVVRTEGLATDLGVSLETVRRDLAALEERGEVRRIHGGAATATAARPEEASFSERTTLETSAKASIGRAAAALLRPGQTVVIDVGTTAVEVARAVPADFHGVVATSSLRVASALAGRHGIEVLIAGGRVRAGDLAVSNAQAVAFYTDLCPDIAFLGSGGVSASGLTDYHLDEVACRRVMIDRSARSYALVDHSKMGHTAPFRVCDLEQLSGVITDQPPPEDLAVTLEAVAEVVVAPHAGELGTL